MNCSRCVFSDLCPAVNSQPLRSRSTNGERVEHSASCNAGTIPARVGRFSKRPRQLTGKVPVRAIGKATAGFRPTGRVHWISGFPIEEIEPL